MNTAIALLNQYGIACASDTDNIIYPLSKEEPVVIIFENTSLPMERIITDFYDKKLIYDKVLYHYVHAFEDHINNYPWNDAFESLRGEKVRILIMGYGKDDIYPKYSQGIVTISKKRNKLNYRWGDSTAISAIQTASFSYIGDFDCLTPILNGANSKIKKVASNKCCSVVRTFKERIKADVKGSKYDEFVERNFIEDSCSEPIYDANSKIYSSISFGIGSFAIEDMVAACEKLINTNTRLKNLKSGTRVERGSVKEIAVITRIEGLTWIKHRIFAKD